MDEQMIADMRDAIWREDHYDPKLCSHGGENGSRCPYCEPHDDDDTPERWPADKDRAERQARAAHSVMAGKVAELEAEVARLSALLNTPEVDDWAKGVTLEAGHQRERWGVDHDEGKSPFDWFWLVGYLAQKAAASAVAGDTEKVKHHTISTGAALANWHLALAGSDMRMRPGIDPERVQNGAAGLSDRSNDPEREQAA